jgi:hypothetical protein
MTLKGTELIGLEVTLWACIREVLGPNLGRETDHHNRSFMVSLVPSENIRLLHFFLKPFYLLIRLSSCQEIDSGRQNKDAKISKKVSLTECAEVRIVWGREEYVEGRGRYGLRGGG